MAEVQSHRQLLPDGDDVLLTQGTKLKPEEGEEFVDLSVDDTAGSEIETPPSKAKAAQTATPAKKEETTTVAPVVDDLPPELKGKSQAELAKMLREAQSLIGRQGSELGDFRKQADLLIKASLANLASNNQRQQAPAPAAKVEPVEIDESEFFANPKKAIAAAIENHPLVKQLRESQGNMAASQQQTRMAAAADRFNKAHPDAGEIMQAPEFQQWVGASPIRQRLMASAHTRYDFEAGDEVFSSWKALQAARKPAADPATTGATTPATDAAAKASEAGRLLSAQAKAKRDAALKAAAAPTGGGGAPAGSGAKKIYRRADIVRLMENDSARYEAMADEIRLAYEEKRVR